MATKLSFPTVTLNDVIKHWRAGMKAGALASKIGADVLDVMSQGADGNTKAIAIVKERLPGKMLIDRCIEGLRARHEANETFLGFLSGCDTRFKLLQSINYPATECELDGYVRTLDLSDQESFFAIVQPFMSQKFVGFNQPRNPDQLVQRFGLTRPVLDQFVGLHWHSLNKSRHDFEIELNELAVKQSVPVETAHALSQTLEQENLIVYPFSSQHLESMQLELGGIAQGSLLRLLHAVVRSIDAKETLLHEEQLIAVEPQPLAEIIDRFKKWNITVLKSPRPCEFETNETTQTDELQRFCKHLSNVLGSNVNRLLPASNAQLMERFGRYKIRTVGEIQQILQERNKWFEIIMTNLPKAQKAILQNKKAEILDQEQNRAKARRA